MNQIKLSQSQDNFHKKISSSKGFSAPSKSDIYPTLIQMIKSDLFQIQEMWNTNSADVKMYKILSKTPGLTRKLNEIEDSAQIGPHLDKINEDSLYPDRIGRIYNCKTNNEWIQKLALELNYYEWFIQKVNDYFLWMKLKLFNDDSYQESLSKVVSIQSFMEKIQTRFSNGCEEKGGGGDILLTGLNQEGVSTKEKEYEEVMSIRDWVEVNDSCKGSKLVNHVWALSKAGLNRILNEINSVISIVDVSKAIDTGDDITNVIEGINVVKGMILALVNASDSTRNDETKTGWEEIDKIKNEYELQIREYKAKITLLEHEIKQQLEQRGTDSNEELKYKESEIRLLKEQHREELQKLKSEIENLKTSYESKLSLPWTPEQSIRELWTNYEVKYQQSNALVFNNYQSEINEWTDERDKLAKDNEMLRLENVDLKRKFDEFNSTNFEIDSYEDVLQEQFQAMKTSYLAKIDEINDQLCLISKNSRGRIYELENELKEALHLRDLYREQLYTLQNN